MHLRRDFFVKHYIAAFLVAVSCILLPALAHAVSCNLTANYNPSSTIYVGAPFTLTMTASSSSAASDFTGGWSFNPDPPASWLGAAVYSGVKNNQVSFSGTPGASDVGTFPYDVTVTDNKSKCPGPITFSGTITVKSPPSVIITTLSLPPGTEGVSYTKQVLGTCSGIACPASFIWSASGLPAGLSINPSSGVISGTPAAWTAGDYNVTIKLSDGVFSSESPNGDFVLTINSTTQALSVTTIGLNNGDEGMEYSYTMSGAGGSPPYSWSATGLPSGLSMSLSGLISGTPAAGTAGDHNVTATVTDSLGATANEVFTLHINAEVVAAVSDMPNYCITPPFIPQEILPNVLLMIDNSSSMFDLSYIDKGYEVGGVTVRDPFYCYDQTYKSTNSYVGYFEENSVYSYNFTTNRFETGSFPLSCTKQIPTAGAPATLCINITGTPERATGFFAKGNYLNWLSASKFDVEKKVLTGGKFDGGSQDLMSESRGCVGRRFIKEALEADYVEGVANASLGITFGVRGPTDPVNPTAPSPGGQTYIEIFQGNYSEDECQTAVELYQDSTCNQECQRTATAACLQYDSHDTSLPGKTQNVFIQTVQECWQYQTDGTVSTDAANTVKNQCPEVYDGFSPGYCSVSTGTSCTFDDECPAEEICYAGPRVIEQGNPALLCNSTYTGLCYNMSTSPYSKFKFTGSVTIGETTYTGDQCIIQQHNKYCGDFGFPPVVDPTDDTSSTEEYGNLPAILGDLGVESQLGKPVAEMRVRVHSTPKEGVIQAFSSLIRFGVLTFNYYGSLAECSDTDILNCPKVCSNDNTKSCTTFIDCPPASPAPTCNAITNNKDAAVVVYPMGGPIGDHNSGLIRKIDDIQARTWTPFAEGFYNGIAYYTQNTDTSDTNRPHRLNAADFDTTENPIESICQENNMLLISDGMSTADQKDTVRAFVSAAGHNDGDGQLTPDPTAGTVDPKYFGSKNLDDLAWYARNKNIFDPTLAPAKPRESIDTFVVYTGTPCKERNSETGICTTTDEAVPEKLMQQTAINGGGVSQYYLAQDPAGLADSLEDAFLKISGQAVSGTAASVLASGEGSGANLVQAVFYPLRNFYGGQKIKWTGRLTNLWYYVDPEFIGSAIYEDTDFNKELNLTTDNMVTFGYDGEKTMATRFEDSDDDGVPDNQLVPDIEFEALKSLWEAGFELWKTDASDRRILTTTGGSLINFSTANAVTLKPYVRAENDAESSNIIQYIRGVDVDGYRARTVEIDIDGDDTIEAAATIDLNGDGDTDDDGETVDERAKVWKLGDVIQSTPRVASHFPLNKYHIVYKDTTYGTYINSADYMERGMVFAGANDGMLHAFKLGELRTYISGFKKAELLGTELGKEIWAFIPKNVLPYLKYIGDPNYCHVYSVDLAPFIFDASICAPGFCTPNYWEQDKTSGSWRTILIGGMRLGGACKKFGTACTQDLDGDGSVTDKDCVNTPGVDRDGNGSISGEDEISPGLSSYFALDITDTLDDPTQDPQLLWEFTHESMGFSTTGPVVVKISDKLGDSNEDSVIDGKDRSNPGKNGKWFVVFGSGPTGPVTTADHQFLGRSDQELKLFVLDLKTGALQTGNPLPTGISNAFGGSMLVSSDDFEFDYQDDNFYVPYVKMTGVAPNNTWTKGGVLRVVTRNELDPALWEISRVIDDIGPVTSSVSSLHDHTTRKQWLFFGTGRYYFEKEPPDDPDGQNRIFGIKDPCFTQDIPNPYNSFSSPCPAALSGADLNAKLINVTNVAASAGIDQDDPDFDGWYINLDGCTNAAGAVVACDNASAVYRTERVITDPLAATSGAVFFTTLSPKDDTCNPGGKSHVWATYYKTGGSVTGSLKGKAILQVSTGEIKQMDLSSVFTEKGNRRSPDIVGVPPIAQGLSILSQPPPVRKVLHMWER
jgi:type IV pilus assembly protein PilY1